MFGIMDDDYKFDRHFKTRATGQLFMGPLMASGYDNRVLEMTVNELEFQNSTEAQKYLENQKKRYVKRNQACNSRKMKMISQYDDN